MMIGALTGTTFLATQDLQGVSSKEWGSSIIQEGDFFTLGQITDYSHAYIVESVNGTIQVGNFTISMRLLLECINSKSIVELQSTEQKIEVIGTISRLSLVE